MTNRLQALDALRGVAILMVMLFHFFYFSAAPFNSHNIYPFGDAFTGVTLFKYGYLGVNLFFIISGFVIAMTLATCASPIEFLIKRFARIWPALLICSIATYFVLHNSTAPFGIDHRVDPSAFLPSLTLTPYQLWNGTFPKAGNIDGTYWSLVVEARFYLLAAILFWLFDKAHFARNMAVLTFLAIIIRAAIKRFSPDLEFAFELVFVPSFLPWFAAGAVFYAVFEQSMKRLPAAIFLALLFILSVKYSSFAPEYERSLVSIGIFAAIFYSVFWLIANRSDFLIVGPKLLSSIGICSYSIYLLHYGIGMTIISLVPSSLPLIVQTALVILVIGLSIFAGYFSYRAIEQPGRRLVLRAFGSVAKPATAH